MEAQVRKEAMVIRAAHIRPHPLNLQINYTKIAAELVLRAYLESQVACSLSHRNVVSLPWFIIGL
jgi:hypothetical protein